MHLQGVNEQMVDTGGISVSIVKRIKKSTSKWHTLARFTFSVYGVQKFRTVRSSNGRLRSSTRCRQTRILLDDKRRREDARAPLPGNASNNRSRNRPQGVSPLRGTRRRHLGHVPYGSADRLPRSRSRSQVGRGQNPAHTHAPHAITSEGAIRTSIVDDRLRPKKALHASQLYICTRSSDSVLVPTCKTLAPRRAKRFVAS